MVYKKLIALVVLLGATYSLVASEKIISFEETIHIQPDGWMDVEERITVNAEGAAIKRGIVREIPLRYRVFGVLNHLPKFELKRVLLDNIPTQFHVEEVYNGKHLFMGSKHYRVKPGVHTYSISYRTNKHIGFFANHDELYWNVTGHQWRFPIEKVKATVYLPSGVSQGQIRTEAYVGKFGSKDKNFTVSIANNVVTFESKKPLYPNEAFTVVVGWPKGFVHAPTWAERGAGLFEDNLYLLILLLGLLAFLILIVRTLWSSKRVHAGTIIPLFEPPKGFTPSMGRYLIKRKLDSTGFASELVQLAVRGCLKIDSQKKFTGLSAIYALIKGSEKKIGNKMEESLFNKLFAKTGKLELSQKNHSTIKSGMDTVRYFDSERLDKYLDSNVSSIAFGFVIGAVTLLLAAFSGAHIVELGVIGAVFIFALILFYFSVRGYTPEGQELVDEVRGFQLFLRTVETERLKMMAPVDKSPELYEKFLPYAIALDAEKNWTQAFAPIFKQFEISGRPYQPVWYYGGGFDGSFNASSFSTSFSSFVSTLHTSSSPTSSSGFGGGGSAGGGGGGGGGGGW